MTADEIAFMASLLAQLQIGGRAGIRVTTTKLVAAPELIKQDKAHAYLKGSCLSSTRRYRRTGSAQAFPTLANLSLTGGTARRTRVLAP